MCQVLCKVMGINGKRDSVLYSDAGRRKKSRRIYQIFAFESYNETFSMKETKGMRKLRTCVRQGNQERTLWKGKSYELIEGSSQAKKAKKHSKQREHVWRSWKMRVAEAQQASSKHGTKQEWKYRQGLDHLRHSGPGKRVDLKGSHWRTLTRRVVMKYGSDLFPVMVHIFRWRNSSSENVTDLPVASKCYIKKRTPLY